MKRAVRKFSETVKIRSSLLVRLRSHRYFPIGLLALTLLTAACIHIWQRVRVLDLVQEVSHLRKEHSALIDDTRKVNSDIASLSQASRMEHYAVDSLGMIRIPAERLYTLVRTKEEQPEADDLTRMLSAVRRVAGFVPKVTSSQAIAGDLRNATIDSLTGREGGL